MFFWPFKNKKKSGDIAAERLERMISTNRKNITDKLTEKNPNNHSEIDSMVGYIKEYAFRNLSVNQEKVKVHVSKDPNAVTIVTNIFYKER